MDVRQLRHVLAVVDNGTFTRAAEACHVAQPSLSQSIRALESELGVELFRYIEKNLDAREKIAVETQRGL